MATIRVDTKVDLADIVLEIFRSERFSKNISNIEKALKKQNIEKFGGSLVYTDTELQIVLNDLLREWRTVVGKQYRLAVRFYRATHWSNKRVIHLYLQERSIPLSVSEDQQIPDIDGVAVTI